MDDIIGAEAEEIEYWTQMIFLHLKVTLGPTNAVARVAFNKWLKAQTDQDRKSVLIITSRGNIDASKYRKMWAE